MATVKARISDDTLDRIREFRDGKTTDAQAIERAIKESLPVAKKISYADAEKTVAVEVEDGKAIEFWIESGIELIEDEPPMGSRG